MCVATRPETRGSLCIAVSTEATRRSGATGGRLGVEAAADATMIPAASKTVARPLANRIRTGECRDMLYV
jgi:hypothetical protein